MKLTITESLFCEEFKRMGRQDQFSYRGLCALYAWLEENFVDAVDDRFEYELDVIGLCCEFAEDNITDILVNYGLKDIEELRDKTCVIWECPKTHRVVYQQF